MSFYDDEDYSMLEVFSPRSRTASQSSSPRSRTASQSSIESLRAQRIARYRGKMITALDKHIASTRSRIAVLEETVKALEIQKAERLEFMIYVLDKYGDLPLPVELTLEEARKRVLVGTTDIEMAMDILGYRKISNGRGKIEAIGFERVV